MKKNKHPRHHPTPTPSAGDIPAPAPAPETSHTRRTWLISLGLLAALTLALFSDVLFTAQPRVLSGITTDLYHQFIHWRAFGFGEMKEGRFPLWNPYLFSGTPYFGGFQSALLYPLNVLFLVLPLAAAINWSIALHVFLAGAFTYAWAAGRRLVPPACFLAAVIVMLGGAHFLHIYAGHLPNLCTMIWAPLLLLAIDRLVEKPGPGWTLTGGLAVAMQILAGHPQYVFYTGMVAAVYCALQLPQVKEPPRFLTALAGIVAGGAALSAVQLFTSFQEAPEMLRGKGVSYEFASGFSFPPENFLTLLAPDFFGDMTTVSYWGRCALWEMCLFIGVSGLVLAVAGAVTGERRGRRVSLLMIAVLLLLALGAHTPLFKAMYHLVPGFSSFRGASKFIFPASLFLALLAGMGLHELIQGKRPSLGLVWGTALAGAGLVVAGLVINQAVVGDPATSWWQALMLRIRETREVFYLAGSRYEDPAFVRAAAHTATRSLLAGAGVCWITTALLLVIRKERRAGWLLPALAAAELFLFARTHLDTFDAGLAANPEIKSVLDTQPGDYRIVNQLSPNAALTLRAHDLWGYDPGVLRRYAEFIAFTEGIDPDRATQFIPLARRSPLLAMLRYHYAFVPQEGELAVLQRVNFLPHVFVAQQYRVIPKRDEIFSALADNFASLDSEVVLESAPNPPPDPNSKPGVARIVDSSSDHLTIEAELTSPGILMVTDTYAQGWQVHPLPGSSQQHYEVMPANYCLRAVPLSAGVHRLRMEYRPSGFVIGRAVSLIALLVFAVLGGRCVRRQLTGAARKV